MKENRSQPEKKQLKGLEKRRLADIEHNVSADVSTFLLLLEEGGAEEISRARSKARADLLKWGNEMQQISQTLGGKYIEAVTRYLNSLDKVLHCPNEYVDRERINTCFAASRKLEKMLK